MRKASLIVGFVCAVFVVLAAIMKLTGFPGGSLLFLVFVSIFNFVALPLNLVWQFRQTRSAQRRAAYVVGMIGLWLLLSGMVYKTLSWPGGLPIIVSGILMIVAFCVLFVISSRESGIETKWFSPITILASLLFLCLGIGWGTAHDRVEFGEAHVQLYLKEVTKLDSLRIANDILIFEFAKDSTNVQLDSTSAKLVAQARRLMDFVTDLKIELVNRANGNFSVSPPCLDCLPMHPEDVDISTMIMVGSDVQIPTGRGMELYFRLRDYVMNDLHEGIKFPIPVSMDIVQAEQWVKDNFYHIPIIDALTRLTVIQENIIQSVNDSIDKKLFVQ